MSKFIVAVGLLLVACGSPSSFDLCHDSCEAYRKCGLTTDSQAQNCHTDCNNKKGTFSDQDAQCERDCTNCGKIRGDYGNCAGVECNKIASCVQAVDSTCVKRN